jgi:GTP-binding protein HflX
MSKTVLYKNIPKVEKCLLVGVQTGKQQRWQVEENLMELSALASTAGAEIVDQIIQERSKLDPAFFVGKGKAEEIAQFVICKNVDIVIFDEELSPTQIKNLEKLIEIKIIDRSALILDIFAAHARSKESHTQVELAQLNYYLPRLTKQWSHLSRQVGGIGTKGPGETQLEVDRRIIRTRISTLKQELSRIEKRHIVQRKKASQFIRAALVGYTNSGKSTLLNALTKAETHVENKLFATLDTTTRRLNLDEKNSILLSDTVGFIRKLPHHLIASFHTTLTQAIEADILLKVIDLSNSMYQEHILVIDYILSDLEIVNKPTVLIMNKVDKINEDGIFRQVQSNYPNAILVSAKKKIRLERIKMKIRDLLQDRYIEKELIIPSSKSYVLHHISSICHIKEQKFLENKIILLIKVLKNNVSKLNHILSK